MGVRSHRQSLALLVLATAGALGCVRDDALSGWTDAAVAAEFERLHRPVLDVLGRAESAEPLWHSLEASFAGEALTEEFVEQFVTLSGMRRDRTRVRVATVDYQSIDVLEREPGVVRVDAEWSVGGFVTHRRHTHPRINRYRARFDLAPNPGSAGELRIVASEMTDLERRGRLRATRDAGSSAGSLSLGDLFRSGLAEELLEEAVDDAADEDPPLR